MTDADSMMIGMEQRVPDPSPLPGRRYTEAEYFAFEEESLTRFEYRSGRVIAMAGGTLEHGLIGLNVAGELRAALKKTPCLVLGSDVRVRISAVGDYAYPDVSVACEPPAFHRAGRRTTLANPTVVVEVLSTSTAAIDLGEKLDAYTKIETLREYVVVDQRQAWARSFHREPGGMWTFRPVVQGLDATLTFESLGVGIAMAEVYAKVTFPLPVDVLTDE